MKRRNGKKLYKHCLAWLLALAIVATGISWTPIRAEAASYPSIQLKVPYYPQKAGGNNGDCGISSIAMIEAYALGYGVSDFDTIYSKVKTANNNSNYIDAACSNGKYIDISMNLESYYRQLAAGNPILIRREPYEHWSVIVGYNGSTSTLQQSGFIVWDTKTGVSAASYDKVTYGRQFDLTRWLKAPNWNGSAWVDRGQTNVVRAKIRGTGAISSGSSGNTPSISFSNTQAVDVTTSSAKIMTEFNYDRYDDLGFYLGTSNNLSAMTKKSEGAATASSNSYKLGVLYDGKYKWANPLQPGTTYYYAFYLVKNGVEYRSPIQSFRTGGTSSNSSFPLVNGGIYKIVSVLSGQTMEVAGASSTNGKQISLWPYSGESHMQWKAIQHADGYSFINVGTGKALDITNGSSAEGAEVAQYDYNKSDAQRFKLIDRGNNQYGILAVCSNLAVDVYGSSTKNGAKLNQYSFHGGSNQLWKFEAIDTEAPVISNVKITSQNCKGYVVSCTVTDNVGVTSVAFPTWTPAYGQDDLANPWPKYDSCSGNTYTYTVNVSKHNYEGGTYVTDIYAYDAAGNCAKSRISTKVKNYRTVTYDANGGSGAPAAQIFYSNEWIKVSEVIPTRPGYTFLYWISYPEGASFPFHGGDLNSYGADRTFYAQWEANTYSVNYNANGGSGAPAAQTKTTDQKLTLSSTTPTRTNYIFTGWNTKANGTGTSYAAGATYTGNAALTLYAQWASKTHTVTFTDSNGKVLKTQKVAHGGAATAPSAPAKKGYTFDHWSTSFNNVTSDLTVKAVYSKTQQLPVDHKKAVKSQEGHKVTTTKKGKASVSELKKPTKKSAVVPSTVTVGDVKYKVTSISANAFKKCSGTTTITLPNTVTELKANAFAGSSITTVKLTVKAGEKLSVDKKAFHKSKVKKIQVTMSKADKKKKAAVIKAFTGAGIKKSNIKVILK